ncbi:soma ferritin-like [Mustela erminea]|uniref:soma ferritin-like n=1 Tax=Mustela erminea TaxID=36723 RepID=UPI001386F658|nr:soma ferritin-like [Mustela erminea]
MGYGNTKTCYYDEDSDAPVYVPFFQDQAVVKREHAKQFIKYLKNRQSIVCLPVTKRPDAEYWGTDREAIVIALEVERNLYKHLQELKNSASKNREIDLLEFVKIFLNKQKRNIRYLQYQLSYQEELERLSGRESTPERFLETWGQEASTSEGRPSSHP